MSTEIITWHACADELPDDDATVMMRSLRMDPPVWMGYLTAGEWKNIEGFPVRDVTHWADIPEGPQ